MRVLICGGRNFSDYNFLSSILNIYHNKFNFTFIIEGGANGADSFARSWAIKNNIDYDTYPAEWNVHGLSAGHIRNTRMLKEGRPDFVIAFPGNKGTSNMIKQSRENKIPVLEIIYPKDRF